MIARRQWQAHELEFSRLDVEQDALIYTVKETRDEDGTITRL
jgi:hypothetical protein